ncbi:MAG: DUF2238 domain-containing protein [Pirellulaceae bacterium]|nr:DUF2238 domain-containing protein [Planctomycetaceae bacterium]
MKVRQSKLARPIYPQRDWSATSDGIKPSRNGSSEKTGSPSPLRIGCSHDAIVEELSARVVGSVHDLRGAFSSKSALRTPPYELHAIVHVVPTWIAIETLLAPIRFFPLSNINFVLVISFLGFDIIGTRYIYSFAPYDQWSSRFLGVSISDVLDLNRNHYDRMAHWLYGLLITPVAREVTVRLTHVRSPWSNLAAIQFILASSMLFELAEWYGAVLLAPGFADTYLGQQGDPWDAHKDMALAAVGALISAVATAIFFRAPNALASGVCDGIE